MGSDDQWLESEQLRIICSNARGDAISALVWATVLSVVFLLDIPHLGQHSLAEVAPWWATMAAWSAGTAALVRREKSRPIANNSIVFWRRAFSCCYFLNGVVWAFCFYVAWRTGDFSNNLFAIIVLLGLTVTITVQQSPHLHVFYSEMAVLTILLTATALSGDGASDLVLAALILGYFAFLTVIGKTLNTRLVTMLKLQLENASYAARLEKAHAAALRHHTEAESASRAKSRFLATMSHELRTPLNAIIGFSDMIRASMFGPIHPKYQGYVEDIHQSGRHLLALINDVFDLQKIEAGELELVFERLDPAQLAQTCVDFVSLQAEANRVELTTKFDPSLSVVADKRALRQILINLLTNAIQHTPAGGRVQLGITSAPGGVSIEVSDSGTGIDPAIAQSIFEPFVKGTHSEYHSGEGGTGLGLHITKQLIDSHEGNIRFKSGVGTGTLFEVFLPFDHAEAAPAGVKSASC